MIMSTYNLKPVLLNFGDSVFSVPNSKKVAMKVAKRILDPIRNELDDDAILLEPILIETCEDAIMLESKMTMDTDALLLV
jgi:hypothetical protein